MKYIWRIETAKGEGPYTGRTVIAPHVSTQLYGDIEGHHPGPYSDPKLGYNDAADREAWYFGFATLTQYRAWCPTAELRRGLREAGFTLNKYEVHDDCMRRSNFQAIFRRKDARLVDTRPTDYI